MFSLNLQKHINEFRRYVRNSQFEKTDDGSILFPKANAIVSGEYTHWVTGKESELAFDHNVITDEGLNHMLNVVMLGTPIAVTDWFAMLHSGTGTPDGDTDAGNYDTQLSEIVSGAEGYSEANRILWAPDAVDTVNTAVTNLASPATFTIITATNLTVNGAGLTSVSAKGSATGTLMSAGKFSATRTLANADEFNLKYKVNLDGA